MPTAPVIPFDKSNGPEPSAAQLFETPHLYQPDVVIPHPMGESRDKDLDLNLNQLVDTIPTKPTTNADKADIYTSAKGTERYPSYNPQYNNEDEYGKSQNGVGQFFGDVVKGLAKGGMSFAQTLTFQPRSDIFDGAKEKLDLLFPDYETEAAKNSNYNWIPFTPGAIKFWGNDIIAGTLDMAGVLAATALQAAFIEGVTGGVGESLAVSKQVGNITMKLSKWLSGVDKSTEFLENLGFNGKALEEQLQFGKTFQANKIAKTGLASAVNAGTNFLFSHYMAAQGSHQVYKANKEELTQKFIDEHHYNPNPEDEAKIDEAVTNMSNAAYVTDVTLFMAQALALPGLLKMFRPTVGGIVKGVEAKVGDVLIPKSVDKLEDIENIIAKEKKGGFIGNVLKPFAHSAAVLGGITAGTESGHAAIKQYFEDKYNGKSKGTINDAIADFGQGLAKTFGTKEGLGEVFKSAIMGGLLGPVEHLVREKQYEHAGLPKIDDVTKNAVSNLKAGVGITDIFDKSHYQGATGAVKAEQDMRDALVYKDPFKYKVAQENAFFNFINTGLENNLHDVRISQLQLIKQLPDIEIHNIFGDDKISIGEKKLFIDKLIDKADHIKDKFDAINELIPFHTIRHENPKTESDKEDNETYDKLQGYKRILLKMSYDKEEFTQANKEIEEKNRKIHPLLSNDLLESITRPDGRKRLIDEYDEEITNLQEELQQKQGSIFHREITNENKQKLAKLKSLKEDLDNIQRLHELKTDDAIFFSRTVNKIVNFELNNRVPNKADVISMEKTHQLINDGVDIQRNKYHENAATKAYSLLFSEEGADIYLNNDKSAKDNLKSQNADNDRKHDVAALGIASTKEDYNAIKNNPEFVKPESKETESRMFVLDKEKDIPGYSVQQSSKADGSNLYSVINPSGNKIKSFDTRKEANEQAKEYNKDVKFPKQITSTGEKSDNGFIKAKDEDGNDVHIHPDVFKNYIPTLTPDEVVNDRDTINKDIIDAQKDLEAFTPTTAPYTDDYNVNHFGDRSNGEEYDLKKLGDVLFSTTHPSWERSKRYAKRTQHFFSNIRNIREKLNKQAVKSTPGLIYVTSANEESLGLKGITAHAMEGVEQLYGGKKNENDVWEYSQDSRPVLAVFVSKESANDRNYHFIDYNGDKIDPTEERDFKRYTFATMPTLRRTFADLSFKDKSRYREGTTDAEILSEEAAYRKFRENLFKITTADKTAAINFNISSGSPRGEKEVRDGKEVYKKFHATKSLTSIEDLNHGKMVLEVATKETMGNTFGEQIKIPQGALVLKDKENSIFQILSSRKLTSNEVDTIFSILKEAAYNIEGKTTQSRWSEDFTEVKLDKIKDDIKNEKDPAKKTELETELQRLLDKKAGNFRYNEKLEDIGKYLQGLTFYRPFALEETIEKYKENSKNLITFTNSGRKGEPNGGGYIFIGGQRFAFEWRNFDDSVKDGKHLLIKDALSNIYTNSNNILLTENKPFSEILGLSDKGNILKREWKSYQHFLISDKYVPKDKTESEKARDVAETPYTTTVPELDHNKPEESNFSGKYAMPIQSVERPAIKSDVKSTESTKPPIKQPTVSDIEAEREDIIEKGTQKEFNSKVDLTKAKANSDVERLIFDNVFKEINYHKEGSELTIDPKTIERIINKTKPKIFEYFTNQLIDANLLKKSDLNNKEVLAKVIENQIKDIIIEDNLLPEDQKIEDDIKEATKDISKEDPKSKIDDIKNLPSLDDSDFRLVNLNEFNYAIHDLKSAEDWFRKNIPFPGKRMENMINSNGVYAFGRLSNDHVEWYKNAKKGTIEHEGFETIWRHFTDARERKGLAKEFRSREGTFTNHEDSRVIKYNEATDYEIKEQLAEELGRYVQDGELYERPKSKGNLIRRMFGDFVNWIKSIFNNDIKKYFDKINSGYYKDLTPVNDFRGLRKGDQLQKLPDLNATQTYNIVKGVTGRMIQEMLGSNKSIRTFFDKDFDINDMLDKVRSRVDRSFNDTSFRNTVINRYKLGKAEELEYGKIVSEEALIEPKYLAYMKVWNSMDKNWYQEDRVVNGKRYKGAKNNSVEKMIKDYIATLGIKTDEREGDDEETGQKLITNVFNADVKKSCSTVVKLLISTITESKFAGMDTATGRAKLIDVLDPITNLPIPIDYSKMFSLLSSNLKDFDSWEEKRDMMKKMSEKNANVERLLRRMKLSNTMANEKVDFNDMVIRSAFYNTFGKQRPDAIAFFINKDGSNVFSAENTNSTVSNLVQSWLDSLKIDGRENGIIKEDARGKYKFDPNILKDLSKDGIYSHENQFKFLSHLGIYFDNDMYNNLSSEPIGSQTISDKELFSNTVSSMATFLKKSKKDILKISAKELGEYGRFKTMAELQMKSLGVADSMFYNIEGKLQSQDVGTNFVSTINSDINNARTKELLFRINPWLTEKYRSDSIYINDVLFDGNNRIKKEKLSLGYIEGKVRSKDKEVDVISSLSHPDRLMLELNANLSEHYYVFVPADSSQEWIEKLKHIVSYNDFKTGKAEDQIYDIFNKYYKTERAIALERGNGELKKDNEGNYTYKSTLFSLQDGYDLEDLKKGDKSDVINDLIDTRASTMIDYLKESGIIKKGITSNKGQEFWKIENFNTEFAHQNGLSDKNSASDKETKFTNTGLKDLFRFITTNYMINGMEMQKLFFGDLADIKDPLKRYKSFMSPREKSLYSDSEFNSTLNERLNKAHGKIQLTNNDYGYNTYGEILKTVTLTDHLSYQTTSQEGLSKGYTGIVDDEHLPEYKNDYKKTNPTDGSGFITLLGHREVAARRGSLSIAEEHMYDYLFAKDRNLMLEDGILQTNDNTKKNYYRSELKEADDKVLSKPYNSNAYLHVWKPIYSGPDLNGKTTLDKYSLAPLTYELVRNGPLKNLYTHMVNEGIHYAVAESGRKIGSDKTHDIYNNNGEINTRIPSQETQKNLLWKYFGIQTETGGRHNYNTLGTQASTEVYMNMLDGGIPIDKPAYFDWNRDGITEKEKEDVSPLYKEIKHNQNLLSAMQSVSYKQLLRKIGITENGKRFEILDKTKLRDFLQKELLRRSTPDNLINALSIDPKTGDFNIALEAISNYDQIRSLLYSKIEKDIAKVKQNGGPKVQVPGSIVGNVAGKEIKTVKIKGSDKIAFVSNGLKFYEAKYDKTGKRISVSRMEIMVTSSIPKEMRKHSKWKNATDEELLEHLNSQDSKYKEKILEGVGFRIPTQELNSIEAFTIKAFLPDYLGDTVVVPEAITTKSGSDFDVDKLNTYLKNIYIDKEGNVKCIPFYGIGDKVVDKFKDFLANEAFDNLLDRNNNTKETTIADQLEEEDFEDLDEQDLEDAEKMYKKSLQNEYYDSMGRLITNPENYERLIKPNSAEALKKISKELQELAPNEFTADKNVNVLDQLSMSQTRHAFLTGKNGGVGIAASNQKNHSLNQTSKIIIDPDNINRLSPLSQDKLYLKDASIKLPHNTTFHNNKEVATISAIKNVAKEYISDNISQGIDGFVDVAKGAWLMDVLQHPMQYGTAFFLLKVGVPLEIMATFINQPIIREYVKLLARGDNSYMLKPVNSEVRLSLLDKFPIDIKYPKSKDGQLERANFINDYKKLIAEQDQKGLNVDKFKDNIKDFYKGDKFSTKRNIEQHHILEEMIKYSVMASHLFEMQQALTYDTDQTGDPSLKYIKQKKVDRALNHSIFSSVGDIMNNTHLGRLKTIKDNASDALSKTAFKIEMDETRAVINHIIDQYPVSTSKDKIQKISSKATKQLISYLVQEDTGLNGDIKRLLVDKETNVAKRILDLKQDLRSNDEFKNSDLAHNKFLEDLLVHAKDDAKSVKNIFMTIKPTDPLSINAYTEAMRELRDNPLIRNKYKDLYDNLIEAVFLQSGLGNSKYSFSKFIPSEDYSMLLNRTMNTLDKNQDLIDNYIKSNDFQRNCWYDKDIIPFEQESYKIRYQDDIPIVGSSKFRINNFYYNEFDKFKKEFPEYEKNTKENSNYQLFTVAKDSIKSQFKFITLEAQDRKSLIDHYDENIVDQVQDSFGNFIPNPEKEIKTIKYLLKRLDLPETPFAKSRPVEVDSKFVYIPISTRGDGRNAEEHYADDRKSVLQQEGYQVPSEIPEEHILAFLEKTRELESKRGGIKTLKEDVVPSQSMQQDFAGKEYTQAEWDKLQSDTRKNFDENGIYKEPQQMSKRAVYTSKDMMDNFIPHDVEIVAEKKLPSVTVGNSVFEDVDKVTFKYSSGKEKTVYLFGDRIIDPKFPSRYISETFKRTTDQPQQIDWKSEKVTTPEQTISEQYVVPSQSMQQDLFSQQNKQEGIKKILPGVELNNKEIDIPKANSFIDILQPQIQLQAYKENKGKNANKMFSFGLNWGRRVDERFPARHSENNKFALKNNSFAGERDMYRYFTKDQNGNPITNIKTLQPIIDYIQSKLGIDMSHYDTVLGNIYEPNTFISQHKDTTESKSAENYPVIVLNLGASGPILLQENSGKEHKVTLNNGGVYAFGINGENRLISHRTIDEIGQNPLKPLKIGDDTINNYRITLTFRRAQDLTNEPKTPIRTLPQDTKLVANIPQNKVSGIESYGSKTEASDAVKKVLGSNPHSIDMIDAGLRTRTTRSADEMAKYNVKVGDVIKNFGKSADGTTKEVLARVTAIHPKGTEGWLGTWNKEGWRPEDISAINRFKDGAAAIEFEKIDKQQPTQGEKAIEERSKQLLDSIYKTKEEFSKSFENRKDKTRNETQYKEKVFDITKEVLAMNWNSKKEQQDTLKNIINCL